MGLRGRQGSGKVAVQHQTRHCGSVTVVVGGVPSRIDRVHVDGVEPAGQQGMPVVHAGIEQRDARGVVCGLEAGPCLQITDPFSLLERLEVGQIELGGWRGSADFRNLVEQFERGLQRLARTLDRDNHATRKGEEPVH